MAAEAGPAIREWRAQRADAFVSSIGVVAHYNWPGDIYDNARAVDLLRNLGVRYYRVGAAAGPGNPYGNFQAPWLTYNYLARHGVHADLVWDDSDFSGDPSSWNPTPDAIASGVSGIASFEGPNEKNVSCTGDRAWARRQRAFMHSLRTYSRAHRSTRSIPILAPSLGNCAGIRRLYADSVELGDLSGSADVGNMHAYAGWTVIPENGALAEARAGGLSYVAAERQIIPSGPLQITEAGYGSDRVSNATQAKYELRLLLNAWNHGISRTYIFALIDDPTDGPPFAHFGIVDGTYTPKPAYFAIKNMIAVLADPSAPFEPRVLAYSLSGDTANVQTTLLQKHDGTFNLCAWVAEAAGGPAQSVLLKLTRPAAIRAQSFDANGELTAVSVSKSADGYSFSVTDTPTILSIRIEQERAGSS